MAAWTRARRGFSQIKRLDDTSTQTHTQKQHPQNIILTPPTHTHASILKPTKNKGDGAQTRSFQYVADLVAGLLALMNSDYDLPVNLGNPDEYTVKVGFGCVCVAYFWGVWRV